MMNACTDGVTARKEGDADVRERKVYDKEKLQEVKDSVWRSIVEGIEIQIV